MSDEGFRRTYVVQLLCEERPEIDKEALWERLRARAGNVDSTGDGLNFAFLDHVTEFADGAAPAMAMIVVTEFDTEKDIRPDDLAQSWYWRKAGDTVARCRYQVGVIQMMAAGLPYKERLALVHNTVMAVLDIVDVDAIDWLESQQYVDPESYVRSKDSPDPDPLYPAVNVRFYNITGREPDEMMIDTVGLAALGEVDLQCHFKDLNPQDVARMVGNSAYYVFDKGDVIKDNETIQGVGEGTRWRCRHEDALLPPKRIVLDIDPGPPYAAGNR